MARNLITGGLGFLGSSLAKSLIEDGEEVILFDCNPSRQEFVKNYNIKDKLKIIQGDLTNWWDVLDVVKNNNIDCIYHLGAILATNAELNPQMAYMVNIKGTFHILEVARLFSVKSVLFPSTIATYGPNAPSIVDDEIAQYPTNIYGTTKAICERLGESYYYKFSVNFRSVRFPAIVGMRRVRSVSSYTSEIILEPALGHPYQVYVDKSTQCPFIYIKDAVRALINLKRANENTLKRRVYNIESISLTAEQEADTVKKYLPQAKIEFLPDEKVMKILNAWPKGVNGANASKEWGFQLKYSLDDIVKELVEEIKQFKRD